MRHHHRPLVAITAFTAVAALALAGCSGGSAGSGGSDIGTAAPAHLSGTVSLWHYFTDREATVVQSVVDGFEKANPDVKVTVHAGQDDDKITKVIASGGDLDVAISSGTDNLGAFCSSGSFIDLDPYIKRDDIAKAQILSVPLDYTKFDGKQCSLPMMSDVYGLYYNTDLLKAAGYSAPPKTLSELEEMALKLTTYNSDGSIKTLGFDPLMGFYENQSAQWSFITGATWMKDGKSAIADDPAWTELMTWQKDLVDKIGYDKLKAFTAGLGDEWSADQAFETGQVAMMLDGEWRVAFISDQKPDLHYATAPFPTGDKHTDLYGGGYASGTLLGISKNSKQKELAWALVKYLTTNTTALVTLANELNNVPTTKAALDSPDLKLPEQFQTFLDIAKSSHVVSLPNTVIGSANQTTMDTFWQSYQAGDGSGLDAGLKKVDQDINNALSLSSGPS
jgi:multiple sugar transport system substrate-binding protein